MALYPLRFTSRFKERIWGGDSLAAASGRRQVAGRRIGESWDISGVAGDLSVVSNGLYKGSDLQDMAEIYMGDLLGQKVYQKFGIEFPLLIKRIDTADMLSIQVHPDDALAAMRHNSYGKTELWYITECQPGAYLYLGFRPGVTRAQYLDAVSSGCLPDLLQRYDVKAGEAYFIPAGTVHAIGSGNLLAEIQQSSDITYRIYDYNRKDADGNTRELHTGLAKDAIDYTNTEKCHKEEFSEKDGIVSLVDCEHFSTSKIKIDSKREFQINGDSFRIIVCTEGRVTLTSNGESVELSAGFSALIPAYAHSYQLDGHGAVLVTKAR